MLSEVPLYFKVYFFIQQAEFVTHTLQVILVCGDVTGNAPGNALPICRIVLSEESNQGFPRFNSVPSRVKNPRTHQRGQEDGRCNYEFICVVKFLGCVPLKWVKSPRRGQGEWESLPAGVPCSFVRSEFLVLSLCVKSLATTSYPVQFNIFPRAHE